MLSTIVHFLVDLINNKHTMMETTESNSNKKTMKEIYNSHFCSSPQILS